MSLMVVDRIQQQEKIKSLLGAFKQASVSEADLKAEWEKHVNSFLDKINERKIELKNHAESIFKLLPRIEELTWFSNIDDDILSQLKGLIQSMDDLSRTMLMTYIGNNKNFTKHGIGKTELKLFKQATDDLKELTDDLKNIFLVLPQDKEFQDITKELNDL